MVSFRIQDEASGSAQAKPVPAPTLGLNTRDHFTDLQPNEARELVNWIADTGSCRIRPGYALWCDITPTDGVAIDELGAYWVDELGATLVDAGGLGVGSSIGPVKALARYVGGSASKLLAAAGGGIYEVLGGVAASLGTGYGNDRWSTRYFNGYVFGVNGTDTPWRWNGTALSATGWTGPGSLLPLRSVRLVGERLWLTYSGSGDLYYGGSMLVTGALTLFSASQIADGGECLGVFPWRDNVVMCYSTGQVLIYQGDPATTFALVAKYYAPPLVEHDAAVEMGSELILMTESGPISMDVIAAGLGFNIEALGNWGKIGPSWRKDFKRYGNLEGWFGKFFKGFAYFNIPSGTNTSKQYVFNTRNQAWSTYENMPIGAMEEVDGEIYIGSNVASQIFHHTGGNDNGGQIVARARPGFSYLDAPSNNKIYSRIKPNITADGRVLGQFGIDVDFTDGAFSGDTYDIGAINNGTIWGSAWSSPWGGTTLSSASWIGVAAKGRAASPIVQLYSTAQNVEWFSVDMLGRVMGPT